MKMFIEVGPQVAAAEYDSNMASNARAVETYLTALEANEPTELMALVKGWGSAATIAKVADLKQLAAGLPLLVAALMAALSQNVRKGDLQIATEESVEEWCKADAERVAAARAVLS